MTNEPETIYSRRITNNSILYCDDVSASLLKYFSRYGEVIDCVVMRNSTTNKSRGFGFVTFKDPACVEMVLTSGPHELDGRQVRPCETV